MKLTNIYFIWAIACLIFIFSPLTDSLWIDIKALYSGEIPHLYLERYPRSFYWVTSWMLRILSVFLNVKIAKTRNENSPTILWAIFALFLPSLSLFINGFMTIKNKKIRKRSILFSFTTVFLLLFSIHLFGTIKRNKEYDVRIDKMNMFMNNFAKENLDTLIISKIDSIQLSLDTFNIRKLVVMSNDSLIEDKLQGYNYVNSKLSMQIKYDSAMRIQYIVENSVMAHPSGAAISVFDTDGRLILRDIYFLYDFLSIVENSKEYYENGKIIKKVYIRKRTDSIASDINDYLLDDERYDFNIYKTTVNFIDYYKLSKKKLL